jgi:hypothetical protein
MNIVLPAKYPTRRIFYLRVLRDLRGFNQPEADRFGSAFPDTHLPDKRPS